MWADARCRQAARACANRPKRTARRLGSDGNGPRIWVPHWPPAPRSRTRAVHRSARSAGYGARAQVIPRGSPGAPTHQPTRAPRQEIIHPGRLRHLPRRRFRGSGFVCTTCCTPPTLRARVACANRSFAIAAFSDDPRASTTRIFRIDTSSRRACSTRRRHVLAEIRDLTRTKSAVVGSSSTPPVDHEADLRVNRPDRLFAIRSCDARRSLSQEAGLPVRQRGGVKAGCAVRMRAPHGPDRSHSSTA